MALPKSWQSEITRRVIWVEEAISSIRDATEPISPTPIEAVLDDETTETEGFVSVSSAVPVSVVVAASVDFDGELGFEMKIGGEWRELPPPGLYLTNPLRSVVNQYVPKGAELRAVVLGTTEGEIEIMIFQGELPAGEGEGGEA
jgi:hypothetical protein